MKNLGIVLLATLAALAGPSAYAANSATATIGANLVTAISIVKVTDLNFGYVVPGGTLGTVVIPAVASPTRTLTGGVVLGNAGSTSSASFTVTGAANATYSITLPASSSISDGTNSMTVNTFTSTPSLNGTLSSGGSQALYVGATMNVAANQVFVAPFAGTFNVTVNYN